MIDLYAIINEGNTIESYFRLTRNKRQLLAIIAHTLKTIKSGQSKTVKNLKIGDYMVYYFKQQPFIFMLATQLQSRALRMHNYLRVVADIFYENYDQKKFHYVLDRIMDEINRTDFGAKKQNSTIEEEQSMLVQSTVLQEKMKLSNMVEKRHRQSRRAYVIMTILFLSIVVLGIFYLNRRWN